MITKIASGDDVIMLGKVGSSQPLYDESFTPMDETDFIKMGFIKEKKSLYEKCFKMNITNYYYKDIIKLVITKGEKKELFYNGKLIMKISYWFISHNVKSLLIDYEREIKLNKILNHEKTKNKTGN